MVEPAFFETGEMPVVTGHVLCLLVVDILYLLFEG